MLKKIVCLVIVGLFAVGVFTGLGSAENAKPVVQKAPLTPSPKYPSHAPIRINNDTDFSNQFSNRTIWGLEINGTNSGCCIYIGNCSLPFTVKDCYLHNANGSYDQYFRNDGLYLYNSSNGTVTGNNCSATLNDGIYLECFSNTNTLIVNNCWGNYGWGIGVCSSNNNTLTGNNCNGNYCGIGLGSGSSNNTLSHNTCLTNVLFGIDVWSNSNTLTNNTCSWNWNDGIDLYNASYNTLMYNNYSANTYYGIELDSSNYNHIHHNNLIDNNNATSTYNSSRIQAYDDTGTNFWNTISEGNYWSDWTSPDANHDGIVDNPYNITGNAGAKDYNPLTTQSVPPPVPETTLPTPLIIIYVLLLTAIVARRRGER